MKRFLPLLLSLALLLSAMTGCAPRGKYSADFYLFDTYCSLTGYAVRKDDFESAFRGLVDTLTVFHEETDIYHEYDIPGLALLNRMAGREPVALSAQLMDFLSYAKEAYTVSGTKVNVMLGAVTALWHETRESGILPTEEALKSASELTDLDLLVLTETTAYIAREGARIDVGALAKGYAGRLAKAYLENAGLCNYILNLGGTIVTGGTPAGTGRTQFTVGIQDPLSEGLIDSVSAAGGTCFATSGDYQRCIEIGGTRYHHLIDPDTLFPSAYQHSVTVVCDDPALADLLSTALFMMTDEEGRALAAGLGAKVYYH